MTPMTLERALEVAIQWDHTHEVGTMREAAAVLRAHLEKGLPFYRAAEEYFAWCDTSSREIAEIDTAKTFAWINQLGALQHAARAAYRASREGK